MPLWLSEGGASTIELELCSRYTRQLLDVYCHDKKLDDTTTVYMNARAEPACRIAMHTHIVDIRQYGGSANAHLTSACVKQREREALSLFRVGEAPAFVSNLEKVVVFRVLACFVNLSMAPYM